MHKRTFLTLTMALLGSTALMPATAFAAPLPTCSGLATILTLNPYIANVLSDNQGLESPHAAIVSATATNAAYCEVHLQFSSRSGPAYGYAAGESQTIGIDIGLPLNSTDGGTPKNPTGYSWNAVNGAWNGKVENLGGGGLAGTLGSTTQATNAGYVGSITDGGHNNAQNGTDGTFAVLQATHQLDVGKIEDFATESLHQQYSWALALAKRYYGQAPTRNYWYGCSTGGRQGLQIAQDWGQDFDGFVIGAPVVVWDHYDLGKVWLPSVNREQVVGTGDSAITINQFNTAVAHAIAACDVEGTDVVADGVIDNPFECKYTAEGDLTILSAPTGTCTGANCLDLKQAKAVDMMWQDAVLDGAPRNHNGKRLWWGYFPSTSNPDSTIGPAISTGQTSPERIYDWDHRDLTGNVQNIYSSRAEAAANPFSEPNPTSLEDEMQLNETPIPRSATTNGATAPTGSYFHTTDYQGIVDRVQNGPKHGKIIMWSSTDDHVWMEEVISYYRAVGVLASHNGKVDDAELSKWYRYYRAPGVGHCGGGVGASPTLAIAPDGNIQMFDDLVNWAENDIVPESAGDSTHAGILAVGPGNFGSRPLCPWPTTAIYNGTGPTTMASSYHCGGNLATRHTLCKLPITPFGHATDDQLNYQEIGLDPGFCEGNHDHDADDDHGKGDDK
jgi:hypothetical protein